MRDFRREAGGKGLRRYHFWAVQDYELKMIHGRKIASSQVKSGNFEYSGRILDRIKREDNLKGVYGRHDWKSCVVKSHREFESPLLGHPFILIRFIPPHLSLSLFSRLLR